MKKRLLSGIATLLMGAGISSGQTPPQAPAPFVTMPNGAVPDTLPVLPAEPTSPLVVPAGSRSLGLPPAPAGAAESAPPLFPSAGMPLFACPDELPLDGPDEGVGPAGPRNKFNLLGCAWVSAEALAWWVKNPPMPVPLLTTAPTGSAALGSPGTTVLYGGNDINTNGPFYGGRFSAGFCDPTYTVGLEVGGFFLSSRSTNFATGSSAAGSPLLSRPFFDTGAGAETGQQISFPGAFSGNIAINTSLDLWGVEANLLRHRITHNWIGDTKLAGATWNTDFLAGVRYMNLNEGLNVLQNTTVLPGGVAGFNGGLVRSPGTLTIADQFQTGNYFYGGQVGLQNMLMKGRYFVGLNAKVALGSTYQVSNIVGTSTLSGTGAAPTTVAGGLLALPSNMGLHSRDAFSVVPEVGVNLGFELFKHVRIYGGYNFLYWSDVVRPGDQIDRAINTTQVPTSLAFKPGPATPAQPAVLNSTTDFFAHGFNAGVAIRY